MLIFRVALYFIGGYHIMFVVLVILTVLTFLNILVPVSGSVTVAPILAFVVCGRSAYGNQYFSLLIVLAFSFFEKEARMFQ